MAVVFISPKQRQKVFISIVVVVVVIFAILFSALIFLTKPPKISSNLFDMNNVNIDTKIFDSEQFKNLNALPEIGVSFSYTGTDKDRKLVNGFISAPSRDDALDALGAKGLASIVIVETSTQGRDNPFVSY